ncbi:hypothetical protein C5O10_03365 [Akkermansia muciniphila]|nr:hypothetical protein C5O09_03335 [Akkermansia muciniphila]QHV15932.1 hypothetical protein C5O10_03365 [Akkermansia muciniphila]
MRRVPVDGDGATVFPRLPSGTTSPSSCHSFKSGLLSTLKATCVASGFTDHVSTRRGFPPRSSLTSTKRTSFRIVGGPSNCAAVMDGGIIRNRAGDLKNDRAEF